MSQKVFKNVRGYYLYGTYRTGTLKKTKKACWEEMKDNYTYYYSTPAKDTPKIISELYDELKRFFELYLTDDRKIEIYVKNDVSEYLYSAMCEVRIRNAQGSIIATTNNYLSYKYQKRLTLEFFDNVEGIDKNYDKFYPIEHEGLFKYGIEGFKIEELKNNY